MTHPFSSLLPEVRAIAEGAGAEILKVYESGDFQTQFKEDHSPLTLADSLAHQYIESSLKRLVSEYPVLSEESKHIPYEVRRSWQTYWLVDPLDGTKEFLKRNGEFTVNIALIRDGIPVLGVLHAPALKLTYSAAEGLGAFRWSSGEDGVPIRVSDYRSGDICIVASRSHAGPRLKQFLELLNPPKVLSMGSALKMCLVAEGSAHFYPRLGPTMEWDSAAAHCIVCEAGGSVTDIHGSELVYNKENLLNPYFFVCGAPPFPWQQYRQYFEENPSS